MTQGSSGSTPLRRRVFVAFVAIGVVGVLALGFVGITFFRQLHERERLIDRLDPALLAGRDLVTALVDQDTGVRGFTLAGEEPFLEPYERGRRAEVEASRKLSELIGDDLRLAGVLQTALRRAEEWRVTSAEPIVDAVQVVGVRAATPDLLDQSRERFERFRAASEALDLALEQEAKRAEERLDRATRQLSITALGGVVAAALAGLALLAALRRWVLVPLDQLGEQTRAVTAGDFERPIEPFGPPEIAALGRDTEAMRRRILAELAAIDEARHQLVAQAEELARSNTDLEQFAYVASHDLQEPLRKVASFCQLLQRRYAGQMDERADQYIEFAVDGAKRMQALINDLLAFSRVGRTTERFEPVDLAAVAEQAQRNLTTAIEESEAKIRVGPMPVVDGDRTLLGALFQNLLGNAIKFRGEEPPAVEIEAQCRDGEWHFRASDNGIGIDPAYADRVFVIFQRLHGKEEYPGTGIGLALCKKIVEFHGGRIWVDPGSPRGTTVRWTLPVREGVPVD